MTVHLAVPIFIQAKVCEEAYLTRWDKFK